MCFVFVLQAWFVATTINLWTSDMYDGSSLDKLYIQDILSIITFLIHLLPKNEDQNLPPCIL